MSQINECKWDEIDDLESIFEDFNLENLQQVEKPEYNINNNFTPTELRISTITALSNIGCNVILKNIHNHILVDSETYSSPVMSIATGDLEIKKSINFKSKKKNKKKIKKKTFFNQSTIILKIDDSKYVNLKIFLNGNIQMTGLKRIEDGTTCIGLLINELTKKQIEKDEIIIQAFQKINTLHLEQYINNSKAITDYAFRLLKGQYNIIKNYNLDKYYALSKIKDEIKILQLYNHLSKFQLPVNFGTEDVLSKVLSDFEGIYKVCDNNKFKIQMHDDLSKTLAEHLLNISDNEGYKLVKKMYTQYQEIFNNYNILDSTSYDIQYQNIVADDIEIVLINSDFSVGFKIKRENLYELLVNEYGIYVTYEPDIYPGVNSKFFWNEDTVNTKQRGVCSCTKKCDGKGLGKGNGDCKKITVAIFQSGNIIITGARTVQQLNDSYDYINNILNIHYSIVKRKEITLKKTDDLIKNNHLYIPKSKINMELYHQLLL